MKPYRLLATELAVQYQGDPIPDVTCDGDIAKHGCDSSRAHVPHVHTMAIGGLTCLNVGDWILPVPGGPFCVLSDGKFRGRFEVPFEAPEKVTAVESTIADIPLVAASTEAASTVAASTEAASTIAKATK